jgi:hypothetical protein
MEHGPRIQDVGIVPKGRNKNCAEYHQNMWRYLDKTLDEYGLQGEKEKSFFVLFKKSS